MNLGSVKQMAYSLGLKKSTDEPLKRPAGERSHLLRRESEARNIQRAEADPPGVTGGEQLDVASGRRSGDAVFVVWRPHSPHAVTYRFPTFCDFCGEMIYGLVRQGLRCRWCRLNFHKRCAHLIPNNCSRIWYLRPSTASSDPDHKAEDVDETAMGSAAAGSKRTESWPTGRPVWLEQELAGSVCAPHTFVARSYRLPTICLLCKQLLKGLYRQGMQCTECKFNVHRRCMGKVKVDCEGDVARKWADACESFLGKTPKQ